MIIIILSSDVWPYSSSMTLFRCFRELFHVSPIKFSKEHPHLTSGGPKKATKIRTALINTTSPTISRRTLPAFQPLHRSGDIA